MKILACLLCFVCAFGEEIDLSLYEKGVYSQNGEDGVLAKIFQVVTPRSRCSVEFGAYDGVIDSNTRLLVLQGWRGVLFDRAYEIAGQHLYREFITAESINPIFEQYEIPLDLDLLSIDIGYNDFYAWKGLDAKYQPAVVVIDYNANLAPTEDRVVKYRPYFMGDGTNYFGASILALYRLGRAKGYSLVYAESHGCNLFFIRDDLLQGEVSFKDVNDVEKLYRRAAFPRGEDARHRAYLSAEELLR